MQRVLRAAAVAAIVSLFAGASAGGAGEGGAAAPLRGVHAWPHSSSAPPPVQGDDAASRCKALVGDFSELEDAPSQVVSADLVQATAALPAVCRLRGYSAPRIGFELDLPTERWNGKFLYHGCFGVCGVIASVACNEALGRGYACVLGDTGHASTASDAKWAYDDLQAEFDFAIRATHVTTLVGKALVARYYGSEAKRSYFLGCSGGGRQAMMEAQRFPWDYDGIVAGAPGIGNHLTLTWGVTSLLDDDGNALLSPTDTALVAQAVLRQCAGDDGTADGLITNPRACRFDPSVLLCGKRNSGSCLDAAQVAGLQKFYRGAFTSTGRRITHGAALPGSEPNWPRTFTPGPDGLWSTLTLTTDFWRYMSFYPDAGPAWTLSQLNWDKDYRRIGAWEALSSATDPDLSRFKEAGAKLLMYKGWADEFSPEIATDYYELVERAMGGRAATQSFFRLFVVPGMGHCYGGPGGGEMSWLGYLEDWVEKDRAPDRIVVYPVDSRYFPGQRDYSPAPPSAAPERAWPVYPYPVNIRYRGSGDPRDPASFVPAEPTAHSRTETR